MKNCVLVLCLMLVTGEASGQSENKPDGGKNSIELNAGIIQNRFIDQGYTNSRLKFSGINGKFGLGYQRHGNRYLFNFSVAASAGSLRSVSGNLPSDFYTVHVFTEYLRRIKDNVLFGKENEFFAGIHAGSLNYYLQNEPVFDNIDLFSLHGVYLSFYDKLNLSTRQSLRLSCQMPVIVFENRVLWNGGASEFTLTDRDNILKLITAHSHARFFDINKNVQLRADYIINISKKTEAEIRYRFVYLNSFEQGPVRLYSNELLLGLKFKF